MTVKRDQHVQSPELIKLQELEEAARSAGKGKFSSGPSSEHVRDVKYVTSDLNNFVESFGGKPVKAIIEHVRDGSTLKALLLPDFYHITLAISGIRCPGFKQEGPPEPFADQARFFVESRILQREIDVILESASNTQCIGSVIHPKGNI